MSSLPRTLPAVLDAIAHARDRDGGKEEGAVYPTAPPPAEAEGEVVVVMGTMTAAAPDVRRSGQADRVPGSGSVSRVVYPHLPSPAFSCSLLPPTAYIAFSNYAESHVSDGDSGSCGRKAVGVQVPPFAPE